MSLNNEFLVVLGEGSDMIREEGEVLTIGYHEEEEKTTMTIKVLEILKLKFQNFMVRLILKAFSNGNMMQNIYFVVKISMERRI